MLGWKKQTRYKELSPLEVDALRGDGSATIVDVREAPEFAAEHIEGAVNMPLSSFDPDRLSTADDRLLILQCRSGGRSAMALEKCHSAKAAIDMHLAGGIEAWKRAGLPVVRG